MTERRIRLTDRRGRPYYVRRAQAEPYRPDRRDTKRLIRDVGLAVLFFAGMIAGLLYWWMQ